MSGGLGYKRFYGGIAYWYFRCAGSYLAALPGRPSLQDVEKSLDDSEKRMMEKMQQLQAENNRLLIAQVLKAVQQQSPKLAFDP